MLNFRRYFLFILLLIPFMLYDQLTINIPDSLNIFINHSKFNLNRSWMDSLYYDAVHSRIRYKIINWHTIGDKSITKLQIPETLTTREVIRQVILYYCLKSSEQAKRNDQLFIYPLAEADHKTEYIRCSYCSRNQFKLTIIKNWDTIPVPLEPTPEEKYIYDQIVRASMERVQSWIGVSEQVYRKIAFENNTKVDTVKAIYLKVLLWISSQ
jgi:DNA-directed RNA polymerase subunit RPC12/RpoP